MAMLAREEVEKITLTENQKQHTYVVSYTTDGRLTEMKHGDELVA